MNIKDLQEDLSKLSEIFVVDKTVATDGGILHIMGVSYHENKLCLFTLQYDEIIADNIQRGEYEKLPKRILNRDNIIYPKYKTSPDFLGFVDEIFIGDHKFETRRSDTTRCSTRYSEGIPTLLTFLQKGWQGKGIEYQNLDMLFMTIYELEGDYQSMPDLGCNPSFRFIRDSSYNKYLVEQPINLIIDGEYEDKIWFSDKLTEGKYWIQINNVSLYDPRVKMEKAFSHPSYTERFSPVEIEKLKSEYEINEECPVGMGFIIIEYECEENITPKFHTSSWLESKYISKNSSRVIIVRPEKQTGICGLKLRAIAIDDQPLPVNTKEVNVELASYTKEIINGDIIIC